MRRAGLLPPRLPFRSPLERKEADRSFIVVYSAKGFSRHERTDWTSADRPRNVRTRPSLYMLLPPVPFDGQRVDARQRVGVQRSWRRSDLALHLPVTQTREKKRHTDANNRTRFDPRRWEGRIDRGLRRGRSRPARSSQPVERNPRLPSVDLSITSLSQTEAQRPGGSRVEFSARQDCPDVAWGGRQAPLETSSLARAVSMRRKR